MADPDCSKGKIGRTILGYDEVLLLKERELTGWRGGGGGAGRGGVGRGGGGWAWPLPNRQPS